MSEEIWWCESHKREATHTNATTGNPCCDPKLGGILLPCNVKKHFRSHESSRAIVFKRTYPDGWNNPNPKNPE